MCGSSPVENKVELDVMCAVISSFCRVQNKDCVLHQGRVDESGLGNADYGMQWKHMAHALWWNTVVGISTK